MPARWTPLSAPSWPVGTRRCSWPRPSPWRHSIAWSTAASTSPPTRSRGNPDRTTDADLAGAAREQLDRLYAAEIAAFGALFAARAAERRTTSDLSDAARAATFGAIEAILVDIDEVVIGTVDETSGAVTFADRPGKDSYGVVDEIAGRALASGAKVLGVRKADIPNGAHLAAILRYPV